MRGAAARVHHDEDGSFEPVPFTLGLALAVTAVLLLVNAVLMQYAKGAVRSALDEGARAAAVADGTAALCEARVDQALAGLLGEWRGRFAAPACVLDEDAVTATVAGELDWWVPGLRDPRVSMTVTAAREHRVWPDVNVDP